MGNANSKSGSAPQSPSPSISSSSAAVGPPSSSSHAPQPSNTNHGLSHQTSTKSRGQPRRKESIHTLSIAKPSASLESATAKLPSTSSRTSAADSLRSQGIAVPIEARTPVLKPADSQDSEVKMGNKESKVANDGRDRSPSRPTSPKQIDKGLSHTSAPIAEKIGDDAAIAARSRSLPLPEDDYSLPPASYSYSRPPRLPLPIEEEVYTPGSPVITPQDVPTPVEPIGKDRDLDKSGRQTSMLSSTTADEDELPDDVVFQDSAGQPLVPTLIEWRQGGDKVYVTGTFVDWDKKVRLHRNGPSKRKDAFSAFINLPPGTHHCRFIVDGDLRLSNDLPTAVDFTNFLTNYVEVAPPPAETPKVTLPVEIPSATKQPQPPPAAKPEYRAPPGVHPPQVLPPTPELVPVHKPPPPEKEKKKDEEVEPSDKDLATRPATLAPGPAKTYHRQIPNYLLDLDAPEESSKAHYASAVVSTLPSPPTLPMFLAKSILNGATPMKDDASVLILPNHTVLNHLATSSIRQKVLATSATTRYKKKFLTTIMYKPTSDVGD